MLVKIEARILIFPGTDFHFPSTSVPPGTFLGSDALSRKQYTLSWKTNNKKSFLLLDRLACNEPHNIDAAYCYRVVWSVLVRR